MQKKDVIYIDVEDDITAIIGKVKSAQEKIVALVPPKRTGVLQSSVNLKLLARAAENADKRLVLITHHAALTGLAAAAEIPVAKNLQSRPEVPKPVAPDNDEEEDVIDGDKLPIGDHARMSIAGGESDDVLAGTIEDLDIDGETTHYKPKKAVSNAGAASAGTKAKKGIKVPNFGSFRKKVGLGIGGAVLFTTFLVWAFVFAPRATVVVTAKTTGQSLATPITLSPTLTSDPEKATLKSIRQTEKISQTVEFEATGTKNIGNKASGTIKFAQQSLVTTTVPVGTRLSIDGLIFITNSSVTIPASSFGPGCFPTACPGTATVAVTASEGGTKYNDIGGSLSGAPSGIAASFTSSTSGGTDKNVPMVSQSDVEKAKTQLAEQNKDDAKDKVRDKFKVSDIVIDSSLVANGGEPQVSPAIGEEADGGKAKLIVEVTYTMSGIEKDELEAYLSSSFEGTLSNKSEQRVYDNGLSSAKVEDFMEGEKNKPDTATLIATAQIGPKINEDSIKQQVKGRRVGEVIGDIKAIDGVSDVEVKLSPFWVSGVPDDIKKINIEFKLLKND